MHFSLHWTAYIRLLSLCLGVRSLGWSRLLSSFNVYGTVQEGQIVVADILSCELDVTVHRGDTVCSVRACTSLVLISTYVLSTYLYPWLCAVSLKEFRALLSLHSHASVCRIPRCSGNGWCSDRGPAVWPECSRCCLVAIMSFSAASMVGIHVHMEVTSSGSSFSPRLFQLPFTKI